MTATGGTKARLAPAHGDKRSRIGGHPQSLGANLGLPSGIARSLSHEVSVAAQAGHETRPRMQPCPECGNVYKKPALHGPDGTCLNATAFKRRRELGL